MTKIDKDQICLGCKNYAIVERVPESWKIKDGWHKRKWVREGLI